jgi:hypothetical protein
MGQHGIEMRFCAEEVDSMNVGDSSIAVVAKLDLNGCNQSEAETGL